MNPAEDDLEAIARGSRHVFDSAEGNVTRMTKDEQVSIDAQLQAAIAELSHPEEELLSETEAHAIHVQLQAAIAELSRRAKAQKRGPTLKPMPKRKVDRQRVRNSRRANRGR